MLYKVALGCVRYRGLFLFAVIKKTLNRYIQGLSILFR